MPLREVNSLRLMIEESGSGDPVVMVHGSWDDRRIWAQVEPELASGFRVITYDRRGHTDSEDGPGPSPRTEDEDDLAALIEELGLAPAHVVGNSFGGSIALGLAARRPELFRTLSAHEPPLMSLVAEDPAVAEFQEAAGPVVELIGREEHEAAAQAFVGIVAGPEAWGMMTAEQRAAVAGNAGTFEGEVADPQWADIELDALASVSFPVLLTRGDQSPQLFVHIVERLGDAIETADVRVLHGAGHVPHETHPSEYATELRAFARG